jgi:protein-S-isoprenylcysteine O-methyltransferase Ste14
VTPENAIQGMWLLWWVSWLAAAAWSDRAVKRPPTRYQIVYRVLAAIGAVLLFGAYRHNLRAEIVLWRAPIVLGWAMAAFVFAGLLFTWWARIHLGRLWSSSVTRKADHHVVDTGPYGIVRHPIYTGIIVASLATATMRGTALGWLGACVMTAGWVIKARLEEEFLREQLGAEAYGAYARRVPMLAPLAGRKRPAGRA